MQIKENKCNICNKFYASYKSHWLHNKKFHKNETVVNEIVCGSIEGEGKKYKCLYCNKLFNDRSNKSKHIKICKSKKIIDEEKEKELLKKELFEIKNTIVELVKQNAKNYQKNLEKNNKNLINNSKSNKIETRKLNISNHSESENKIIQSENKKYLFDFNNNLLLFNNKAIKYFYFNNQLYFKSNDISSMLDYDDTFNAIIQNIHEDDKINITELLMNECLDKAPLNIITLINNEDPQTIFINEFGFYNIILLSKNKEASEFKKWFISEILPSIRKHGSYNIMDNYSLSEENLDNYENKDCVYIINIKDNIYKFGYSSHIFKRLQTHKTNLNYIKIIKIYDFNNIAKHNAIKLENKIKKLIKAVNINIIYFNHVEIFEVDQYNLQNIINKIDDFYLNINKNNQQIELNKQMEILKLENENLKLKFELLKK